MFELRVGQFLNRHEIREIADGLIDEAVDDRVVGGWGLPPQLLFQTGLFLPGAAKPRGQLLPGDQIVRIEIHQPAALLLQALQAGLNAPALAAGILLLTENAPAFLPEKLRGALLIGYEREKVRVKGFDQSLLVDRRGVRTVVCALSVALAANPADVCIAVGAADPAERPAALAALNQGGKQMLIAVASVVRVKCLIPGCQERSGLPELCVADDPQLRTLADEPLGGVPADARAGEKIGDLLLAVDDLAGVDGIGQNAADCVLAPIAAALGFEATPVQLAGNFTGAAAIGKVPAKDLLNDGGFLGIDGQMKIVAHDLVVAVDQIGHPALFRVHVFAEFDAFGRVGGFLLRQRAEHGENELAVSHGMHVDGEKNGFDPQRLQMPDALQKVDGVAGKTRDVLDHDHLEKPPFGIRHHLLKFSAAPDFCAGKTFVGVDADKVVAGFLRIFHEELLLRFQTVELILLFCGDAAVCCDVDGGITSFPWGIVESAGPGILAVVSIGSPGGLGQRRCQMGQVGLNQQRQQLVFIGALVLRRVDANRHGLVHLLSEVEY